MLTELVHNCKKLCIYYSVTHVLGPGDVNFAQKKHYLTDREGADVAFDAAFDAAGVVGD